MYKPPSRVYKPDPVYKAIKKRLRTKMSPAWAYSRRFTVYVFFPGTTSQDETCTYILDDWISVIVSVGTIV